MTNKHLIFSAPVFGDCLKVHPAVAITVVYFSNHLDLASIAPPIPFHAIRRFPDGCVRILL